MLLHIVLRPGIARDAAGLDAALARLRAAEEGPCALPARWCHSYALRQADGHIGLACVFEADGVPTLRRHASLIALPAGEILPVATTLRGRPFAPTLVWLVRRRAVGTGNAELERRAATARRIADEGMPARLSWLTSHVVHEPGGTLGLVCLYQAVDREALIEHAARVGMPADEITAVLGRVDFRADAPVPAPLSTPQELRP